jgi:hypothetical protein
MVDTSTITNETIYEISAKESSSIVSMETAPRQGSAGGRFHFSNNVDHDVASLSPATKHTRVFVARDNSLSTKLSVVYVNYAHESGTPTVVECQSVYNDVLMKRMNSEEKRRAALGCSHLRSKCISEMKSRLRCFMVMDHYGLKNSNCDHWQSFIKAMRATQATVLNEWQTADPSLDPFDCALLEWCCSTGEMRNHQALAVHVDANKSHSVESMQAFGRVDPSLSHLGKTRQVSYFRDAILCALWQMVALRVRCGRDIWHLSFGNTHHLPDRSRDKHNFTWVHGP